MAILGGGNPWLGLWFAWFMYLGNVPDWGCYFTMAQGPAHVPASSHLDCAHEPRRGIFDWLIGRADFVVEQSYEVRLMRDWCGMWMRGLVWLGPAGLGLRAGGFDATMALGGGLMPIACESPDAAVCPALEFAHAKTNKIFCRQDGRVVL